MRNSFAKGLTSAASKNEEIILFYADIGNNLFNSIKSEAPERVFNAGIAEANMASMAAGAAKMGFKPFIYTITPFTTARNFEQIKVDIAYANLPVVIVGTGSGLSYAALGPTHHSFEDIALMRSLPNMIIVCPADSHELELLLPKIIGLNKPCYFRIGKKNEPIITQGTSDLELGKANILEEGKDIAIFSSGTSAPLAQEVAQALHQLGKEPEFVSFHTIKPLDEQYLKKCSTRFKHIVTIEEHNVQGGFGSAILEFFNEQQLCCNIHRFGIHDQFIDKVGSRSSALEKTGLTTSSIVESLKLRGVI